MSLVRRGLLEASTFANNLGYAGAYSSTSTMVRNSLIRDGRRAKDHRTGDRAMINVSLILRLRRVVAPFWQTIFEWQRRCRNAHSHSRQDWLTERRDY